MGLKPDGLLYFAILMYQIIVSILKGQYPPLYLIQRKLSQYCDWFSMQLNSWINRNFFDQKQITFFHGYQTMLTQTKLFQEQIKRLGQAVTAKLENEKNVFLENYKKDFFDNKEDPFPKDSYLYQEKKSNRALVEQT